MKKSYLLAASFFAFAALPAAAFAGCNQPTPTCGTQTEKAPDVYADQVQTSSSNAFLNVDAHYAEGASLNGTAAGNAFSVRAAQTDTWVASNQKLYGNVKAKNEVKIEYARGLTNSNAIAQGNAAQIEANGSNIYNRVQQIAEYGSNIDAVSHVHVKSSDFVVSNAQAAANNFALASKDGYVENYSGQYAAANVNASSVVTACCNNGSVTSSALAAGNSNSIIASNSTVYSTIDQKNYGNINANAVILNNSATNNLASATAVANNANVTNEWGYAQMVGYQQNSGEVNAQSLVLNDDWRGTAVSSSSATANSALLSNIGSDARLDMIQNNFGAVTSYANLVGSSSQGGVGMASSFAAGNTMTGFTCAGCGGGNVAMNGSAQQFNYAPVTAYTNINAGSAGMIVGSATAIGNNATFIAKSN